MALDSKRLRKAMRKLRKLVRKAPKRPTPDNIHDLRTYTRRFEAAAGALKLDSRRNDRRLLRDLSRARKRAGKIRDMDVLTSYTASVHADQQQDCLVQLLEYLGEVKDAIGEWHDWEELIAIAADLDEHGPNCKLVEELKKISERKYEHALSLTNHMRRDYLRGSAGGGKRGSAHKLKPAPPLLHAVSAIAS